MGRRMRSFVIGSAVVALSVVAQMPAANAAFDQTPPSLTVNVTPSFVVGNVVTDGQIDTVHYTNDIEQLIQWSATDDVGVCSYDLFAVPAGAPPEMLLEFSQDTQFTYAPGSDYNGDFGGGSNVIDGFVVTARDCNGNATTKAVDEHIFVFQEDGLSPTDGPQSLTYTGTWGVGNCTCFLAGHTASSTVSGARATFTRTFTASDQIALVMAEGPGRGTASIRIDGRWLMNIDTFANVNTNRVVVFERAMSAGTHTLTIVNHGTPGRPRIDLDAILVGHSPAG